jgi:hypothetical protein
VRIAAWEFGWFFPSWIKLTWLFFLRVTWLLNLVNSGPAWLGKKLSWLFRFKYAIVVRNKMYC